MTRILTTNLSDSRVCARCFSLIKRNDPMIHDNHEGLSYHQDCILLDDAHFTIIARRWFDRKNGNTYHSCEVYRDGVLVGREPFAHGYGDGYRQTAHEILQNAGIMPKTSAMLPSGTDQDYYNFLATIRDYDHWLFSVTDVTRKKDL